MKTLMERVSATLLAVLVVTCATAYVELRVLIVKVNHLDETVKAYHATNKR